MWPVNVFVSLVGFVVFRFKPSGRCLFYLSRFELSFCETLVFLLLLLPHLLTAFNVFNNRPGRVCSLCVSVLELYSVIIETSVLKRQRAVSMPTGLVVLDVYHTLEKRVRLSEEDFQKNPFRWKYDFNIPNSRFPSTSYVIVIHFTCSYTATNFTDLAELML